MGIFGETMRGVPSPGEPALTLAAQPQWQRRQVSVGVFFFGCAGCQLWHLESLVAAFELLAVACGIQFPNQGSNPCPLCWERTVPGTGPPGKSQCACLWCLYIRSFGRGEGDNETSFSSFCPTSLVHFSSVWSFLGLLPKPTSTLETKSALFITQGVQAKKPTGENVRHGSGRGWNGDVTLGFRESEPAFETSFNPLKS